MWDGAIKIKIKVLWISILVYNGNRNLVGNIMIIINLTLCKGILKGGLEFNAASINNNYRLHFNNYTSLLLSINKPSITIMYTPTYNIIESQLKVHWTDNNRHHCILDYSSSPLAPTLWNLLFNLYIEFIIMHSHIHSQSHLKLITVVEIN